MQPPSPALSLVVGAAAAAAVMLSFQRRRTTRTANAGRPIDLKSLSAADIPPRLLVQFYIDLDAAASRRVEEAAFLRRAHSVVGVLDQLHAYVVDTLSARSKARDWVAVSKSHTAAHFAPDKVLGSSAALMVEPNAIVLGGTFDTRDGAIWIGPGATVEPGTLIRGPAIIGARCTVRHGAYIRGDVVLGLGCVVGGEIKHSICLDECELPHHGYVGDSLLGHRAHFGCGALTANLPLFAGSLPSVSMPDDPSGTAYVLGRRKFGAVVGDGSQLGCGSVTEPGCLLGPSTHAYPLSRVPRGCHGPHEILKTRPVVERAALVDR